MLPLSVSLLLTLLGTILLFFTIKYLLNMYNWQQIKFKRWKLIAFKRRLTFKRKRRRNKNW
ncbi:hypothetical protein AHMF7605_21260 [Adhaeribacter arboris]|uniref:Uncharacterized protein n=1 Tax=Adhaeribacter arboris TaxID=2072846 RepID=A0A2T2YK05_9BACT|nr:hypothetical protein AHMF7605_21260 [Adhaeribacter arboris]